MPSLPKAEGRGGEESHLPRRVALPECAAATFPPSPCSKAKLRNPPPPLPRIHSSVMTLGSSGAGSSVVGEQSTSLLLLRLVSCCPRGIPAQQDFAVSIQSAVLRHAVRAAARSVRARSDSSRSVEEWIRDDVYRGLVLD
jgi:hypothetical protein